MDRRGFFARFGATLAGLAGAAPSAPIAAPCVGLVPRGETPSRPIATGLPVFDKLTGGVAGGSLIVCCGLRTSHAMRLVVNMVGNIASRPGIGAVVFSSPEREERVHRWLGGSRPAGADRPKVVIDESPSGSAIVQRVEQMLDGFRRRVEPGAIAILGPTLLWTDVSAGESRERLARKLRLLARSFDVPVFVVVPARDTVRALCGPEPVFDGLPGSRAGLVAEADLILDVVPREGAERRVDAANASLHICDRTGTVLHRLALSHDIRRGFSSDDA